MSWRLVGKTCCGCGASLPLNIGIGDRCPSCHGIFGSEKTTFLGGGSSGGPGSGGETIGGIIALGILFLICGGGGWGIWQLLRSEEKPAPQQAAMTAEADPTLVPVEEDPGKLAPPPTSPVSGQSDVPSLMQALKEAGPEEQQRAVITLRLHGQAARPAIPLLLEALPASQPAMHRDILETLRVIGPLGPEHEAQLVSMLTSGKSTQEQSSALEALAHSQIASPQTLPWVLQTLKNGDPLLRAKSTAVLAQVGNPRRKEVVPFLIESLHDSDPRVVQAAADALVRIGPPRPDEIPGLTALLADPCRPARQYAVNDLALLGPEARSAVTALASLYDREKDADLRARTIEVLPRIQPTGKETTQLCIRALKDPDPRISRQAARLLLASPGDLETLAALIEALDHTDPEVSREVRSGLQGMKPEKQHAPAICNALQKSSGAPRLVLLGLLQRLGPDAQEAAPALCTLLKEGSAEERAQAVGILGQIGPPARIAAPLLVPLTQNRLDESLALPASEALALMGAEEANKAVPFLIRCLRVEDPMDSTAGDRRDRARKALARIGKPALPAMLYALGYTYAGGSARTTEGKIRGDARQAVIEGLTLIGPQARTNEALLLLARVQGNDPLTSVREAARKARAALLAPQ